MGATMSHGSGVWKACPICGKLFFIASRETWVYKRWSDSGPCYFHTWSCMRKYEEQHANDLHEKRVKAPHFLQGHIIIRVFLQDRRHDFVDVGLGQPIELLNLFHSIVVVNASA